MQESVRPEKFYLMRFLPANINKGYADFKLLIDKKRGYKSIKKIFSYKNKYELNLNNPQSYNEKIIWKKLFDRNPALTITADKYKVRNYITSLLGPEAEKILVPLIYECKNPNKIPFDTLPEKYVIKPNHGSKMHLLVMDNKSIERKEVIKLAKQWLNNHFGVYHYEWAYRNIERRIIIEKLLETRSGKLPKDYKLYCFHGKCRVIRVSENRLGGEDVSAYYDTNWKFIPVQNPGYLPSEKPFHKPDNLKQMINLAERLSVEFDAVRIDLYDCDGELYFGEFTHYDASGMARFEPESFDFEMGKYWKLTPNYWKKGKLLE